VIFLTAIQLLRDQLKGVHELQEQTMADVDEKAAHFNQTNKAFPVGAAYAHSVISEDIILSTMVAHKEPVLKEGEDIGLSEPMPSFAEWEKNEAWVKEVKVDLEKFRAYAKQVYQASDDYLSTLTDEDLDAEVDMGQWGKHTLAHVLSNFIVMHGANLTGEISAAKGFQGLKGYPF
jgi:hypothetical protein